MSTKHPFETVLERGIFASRWLMAPMYLGLILALVALCIGFGLELWHFMAGIFQLSPNDVVLGVLSLIDLTLAGNLLVIVIFSGYENFVSKLDMDNHEDTPEWQGTVDFSTLKLKLVASIVAISGIHLLKVFMNVTAVPEQQIRWMVMIHLVFVASGVLLALMDYIASKAKVLKKK